MKHELLLATFVVERYKTMFMKNTYLLIIATFVTGFAFGQVDIHQDSDPGTSLNGTSLNVTVDSYGYNVYMHVVNTSGATQDYKFRRVILSQSTSFNDQFCDNNLCYPCSGTDYVTPSSVNVPAGDSSIMKPVLNFTDGGTAVIRYYVLDANNNDMPIDSMDLDISSVMSVQEIDISFTSYPNPASDDFFIKFQGNEGINFQLVIYNVLGEEVMSSSIVNGTNKINVAHLNNGVYFYSIVNNDDIIETKKLIVRH